MGVSSRRGERVCCTLEMVVCDVFYSILQIYGEICRITSRIRSKAFRNRSLVLLSSSKGWYSTPWPPITPQIA